MKKHTLLLFLTAISMHTNAQFTGIQWQKALGGSADDIANDGKQTTDGGYIIAGQTQSIDSDVTFNHGGWDYWVVKLDASGTIEWQKTYGGTYNDYATSILQTADGGYMVAGYARSNDGDVTGNHSAVAVDDYWIIKLNSVGALIWQKCYGSYLGDYANSIAQTNDGNFVIVGTIDYTGGDVTFNHGVPGTSDYWVIKIDTIGNLLWEKSLGGTDDDYCFSVSQTNDGGCIVAGIAFSTDGDVTGNIAGADYWVANLDINGTIQWEKSYGGSGSEGAYSIQQTNDGGYIIAGGAGYMPDNHGGSDFWIVKTDSIGTIEWSKSYGGSNSERCYSIQQTIDGGYIAAGSTPSNDGDVTGFHGLVGGDNVDCWIVKVDSLGIIQWEEALGGTNGDGASTVQQTNDGGYIVVGSSGSYDGDLVGQHGIHDWWVIKLSQFTSIDQNKFENNVSIYPNPSNGIFVVETNIPNVTKILVMNMEGKVVISHKVLGAKKTIVNMLGITKGTYEVQIQTGFGVENKIIIIQ